MNKKNNRLIGAGVLSSIAASLCCITPVLALISGASGVASAFSWLEPARPYLIGITMLVLGFAWYQKLKPKATTEIQCACEAGEKPPFMQTKKFLGIVTIFAFLMLAFPYYGHIFYPKADKEVVVMSPDSMREVSYNVSGMTCASCEEHVKHAVNALPGIVSISVSSDEGTVDVKFDNAKTNETAIAKAIDGTGYKVSGEKTLSQNLKQAQSGHTCGPDGCK
ncbi:mercuric transport protein MerTP [Elizabethkingia miricola]|uniref:Mercuric transport protein MerT n=2 Tax=Elizabethkingia TaxID=308865 RepID=A0ABD5B9G9_ELIMR|nr:mercuric transport protein MerTP [Elizabethkingia miricola]MBS1740479.1 mercuric transport protein MerTP [Bacteroidota bacterium]MDQ8750059.1 mercuric transport protein MerTP [Elizabethkingia miricola]MDV3663241.1 heavy metal transporter [Elizabethkingia anophelis]